MFRLSFSCADIFVLSAALTACASGSTLDFGGSATGGGGTSDTNGNTTNTSSNNSTGTTNTTTSTSSSSNTACGDGTCDWSEDCESCPLDCDNCNTTTTTTDDGCGDGTCDWTEDCESCEDDCGSCGDSCNHDVCSSGAALSNGCSSCVTTVCAYDSYCCSTAWDSTCVSEAESYCGEDCGGGGNSCAHSECTMGAPLDYGCSDCVTYICGYIDDFCCYSQWDDYCVAEADYYCGGC